MELELEWQKQEQEGREYPALHDSPEMEYVFYTQVQAGELLKVEANLQSKNFYRIASQTKLSDNLLQNIRYHCIITLAMITRYCIEGGMPSEMAYRKSDFYIQKTDIAKSAEEVEIIHDIACRDYAKHMHQLRNHTVCSKPVTTCLNYIYTHLHEKITVKELAKTVHLHPSHLSRLFHQQVGCTIHQYITKQKVMAAKQMLLFSENSYAEIANILSFSSQSHFIHAFSDQVGMTPRQFREVKTRSDFISHTHSEPPQK